MFQIVIKRIIGLAVIVILGATLLGPAQSAQALFEGSKDAACQAVTSGTATTAGTCGGDGTPVNNLLTTAINLFSLVVGIIAIIMIVVGGLKYATSQGDSATLATARNTIIYAIVGLVIVATAQVIVRFVINRTDSKSLPFCPTGTKMIKKAGDCAL